VSSADQHASARRWYKARQRELRDLIWTWDPLGLVGGADDEYDSLVDGVLSALVNRRDDETVAVALLDGLTYLAGEGYSARLANQEWESDALAPVVARIRAWWNGTAPPP
jgi:hypothetical protein